MENRQKVTGEASMRIDLRGFPKGTKTQTKMSGMFQLDPRGSRAGNAACGSRPAAFV
jgi:hypothetical protein